MFCLVRKQLATLDERHLDPVQQLVQRILSTPRAEYIFAQVVEGCNGDPEIEDRNEPSPEALNLVRSWRSRFEPASLEIDIDVLQKYRESRLGTREAKLCMIEVTAVVIHHLAALLFEHINQLLYKRPEPTNGLAMVIESPYPTYLSHNHYLDDDMYPVGVADVVAYWAETHLFGGVVVFNHGKSDTEFLDLLLHPDNKFQVFKLSEAQIDQFIGFGLYSEPSFPCPFPIKAERDTIKLPGEHKMYQNIYRSKSDRKVPEEPPRLPCVRRAEGDPYIADFWGRWERGELEVEPDGTIRL
ncbi:hypothetical protein BDV06DRAFT_231550 [Aspergillus oleicola]